MTTQQEHQHSNPLVSVIVPIYGVEAFLDQCVESIVNQTYANLEILLVDDGSKDNCHAMVDEWARRDSRIIALHKPNGGLSDARNYGLERASGEYVYFVDSDDWIEPQLVQTALRTSQDTDSDMVVIAYNSANEDGSHVFPSKDSEKFPAEGRRSSAEALTELWNDKIQNFSWSIFAKRSVYDGIRFPLNQLMEDMGTTYKLYDAANAVYFLPVCLYNYRVRSNSILDRKPPAMSADTVKDIKAIDIFAQQRYPELLEKELNWSVRYLSAAIIWASESKQQFDRPSSYRAFVRSTRKYMTSRIKKLGVRRMTLTNMLKVTPIYLHCQPALTAVSKLRDHRRI
ncbi:glycosyltransferase family 2 protein [Bifidobacterium gallicum]|uniref:Glycosyl transferase CpsJ n=1 Tax=Bifidobacterium gallicum DSM 20093 = LMG 11596 TaxID=561180 RepID=A0A087AJZ0_9BIFI|nr:glycosyltransferase [Bifidobacterium gallicum]KFI59090.1 glycosyl transferase CpsJ [Bifidobacterium gallicum DSM 20093 = LMG 11596]